MSGSADKPATPAARLVRSGILDVEFYTASSGCEFAGPRAAARHCIDHGMPAGLSPNPFLSVDWLPGPVQRAWRRGQINRLLGFLQDPAHWSEPWGPLFDPQRYARSVGDVDALLPLGPLAHLMRTADESTELPVPSAPWSTARPLFGPTRQALLRHATLVATQTRQRTGDEIERIEPEDPDWRRRLRSTPLARHHNPLVTVVVPVGPRIGPQPMAPADVITMLRRQTMTAWELLLIPTGTDPEPAAEAAAAAESRARLVPTARQSMNWRSSGLTAARGSYVVFLDQEHSWRPDFLHVALAALQSSGRPAGQAAVALHDPSGDEAVVACRGDRDSLRTGAWVEGGVLVAAATELRAIGLPDDVAEDGYAVDLALRLAQRTPLVMLPFIGSDRTVPALPSHSPADLHGGWLSALARSWVDWDQVRLRSADRQPGRVSVVVPTFEDAKMTVLAVRSLLATTSVPDIEIVIVDNGSSFAVGQELVAVFDDEPRVHYRRLPVNLNFAIACNVGFSVSTGSVVVFLNNDTRSDTDWLPNLLAQLDDSSVAGAQPLLTYPDGTIQTAGTIFPTANGLPCHFLTGQPREAAHGIGGLKFSAATAAVLAMRAADLAFLEGFDARYVNGMEDVDLCLRALAIRPGGFRVEPSAVVTHLEGKTKGRSRRIPDNRSFFMHRWGGLLPGPETELYARVGYTLVTIDDDGLDIPSPRPVLIASAALTAGPGDPGAQGG